MTSDRFVLPLLGSYQRIHKPHLRIILQLHDMTPKNRVFQLNFHMPNGLSLFLLSLHFSQNLFCQRLHSSHNLSKERHSKKKAVRSWLIKQVCCYVSLMKQAVIHKRFMANSFLGFNVFKPLMCQTKIKISRMRIVLSLVLHHNFG